MPRRSLNNQFPGGMRNIPVGGEVTSALLKRIIKLVNEEREKPFSKQEVVAFTHNLQQGPLGFGPLQVHN